MSLPHEVLPYYPIGCGPTLLTSLRGRYPSMSILLSALSWQQSLPAGPPSSPRAIPVSTLRSALGVQR